MYVTTKKLKKCKKMLKAWSKDHLLMLCKGLREQKNCCGKQKTFQPELGVGMRWSD